MALRVRPMVHSSRPIPSRPASKRSYTAKSTCNCSISPEKIRECIVGQKKEAFRIEMGQCRATRDLKIKWESYQIETFTTPEQAHCKATKSMVNVLPATLIKQENIKAIGPDSLLLESHLSVLTSEPLKVNLAGEGGMHVGKKEYWTPILERLQAHKHMPVCIMSIGGGIGFDLQAISAIFKSEGFKIHSSTVIDPNRLAAFLAENNINYYVTTSQHFFNHLFIKEEGVVYIIHLGTTLNVVKEEQVIEILKQVAQNMGLQDVLSIIMVDKKQFVGGKFLAIGPENDQGLAKVTHLPTNKHYKTVIMNRSKFAKFMSSLNLNGELIEITEKGKMLNVAFIAYKGMKESQTSNT